MNTELVRMAEVVEEVDTGITILLIDRKGFSRYVILRELLPTVRVAVPPPIPMCYTDQMTLAMPIVDTVLFSFSGYQPKTGTPIYREAP